MCQYCFSGVGVCIVMSELATHADQMIVKSTQHVTRNSILLTSKEWVIIKMLRWKRKGQSRVDERSSPLVGQYATLRPAGTHQSGAPL